MRDDNMSESDVKYEDGDEALMSKNEKISLNLASVVGPNKNHVCIIFSSKTEERRPDMTKHVPGYIY